MHTLAADRSMGAGTATTAAEVPILIVDDNASKRLAVKAILTPLGHKIVEADSGMAALRILTTTHFAVILLDVRMPIMDGFETAALIRLRRQSETTPIIFLTAYSSDEIVAALRYSQGAADFLTAPIQPDMLRAKVSAFANLYRQAQDLAVQTRAVQDSAERLGLLTEAAPIGIFETEAENRYVYTNPRWAEITGVSSEDAIGQRWDVIIDAAGRAAVANDAVEGLASDAEFSHRFRIGSPGGTGRIVLLTSKPIKARNGAITGWVGTLADVSAEADAETALSDARDEADEASRLKSDFLANMSHEIRTPMNGVLGMTDLLLDTDLDAGQRDYVQTLRNSGEALLTVINDILDFSKIESGKMEIDNRDFTLHTIVDDVVDLLEGSAETKGLRLRSVFEDSLPTVVNGDPGRLRQVLTNLVGNAIKFTERGEVVVTISAIPAADGDSILRFEISDTGVGVAAAKLEVIFDPFIQADTSTSRTYGGTGLGLAISSQLVGLMCGQIGAFSKLGSGSTFWFTVSVRPNKNAEPGGQEDEADREPRPPLSESPRANGAGLGTLLLAEDNLINQKVAVAMLLSAGYRVETVRNGAEAVRAARKVRFDAILMDCQMPELNGYEATAAIRSHEGAGRHTPIIALTAGARREDRERCLAQGMDTYLAKPFRREALLEVVRSSINSSSRSVPVAANAG